MSELRIVRPGEGRPWWWQGTIVRWLATGDDTDGRFALPEVAVRPGHGPGAHTQTREDECFYVLSGGPLAVRAGNRTERLQAGDFIQIGRGTAHDLKNESEADAKLLVACFPAGFDRFQFEAGEAPADPDAPRKASEADRRKAAELAPKFGIELNPGGDAFEREPAMHLVHPGGGPSASISGNAWTALLTGEQSRGDAAVYQVAIAPGEPGYEVHDVPIALYVVQGTLGLAVGDDYHAAPPGTLVQLPAGTSYRVHGTGDQPGRALIWTAPAHDLMARAAPP